jgi:ribonuclease III family protein
MMEVNLQGLDGLMKDGLMKKKPQEMPGLALAFIGDAVWEILVRQHLLMQGEMKPDRLHKFSTRYVRAKSQSDVLHFLLDSLTEEELNVVKRGRNAKSGSSPKNAEMIDYRHATGYESLLGYLYMCKRYDRIHELAVRAISWLEEQTLK